ncbi:hypothetical protein Y1Q_0002831 [Alligator mississippiensis]|uniref:Reverse transcriptase/retrotransposon-derived protein RNase H-like domain-containing protein n=1 Tax=Alligator mississippiensis TaxID=8496 RepID=A0A151NZL2_ALLMI|nr:hypothetical protein Y1Q_0002831 [Alligator mississippiensis]
MQLAAMASLDVTDASETAIGAVLTQEDDGLDRPIAYASWKLLPMETCKELQFTLVILQGWHNKSSNCHESSGPFLSGEKSEVQTEPAREKQGSMGPCWEARDCMAGGQWQLLEPAWLGTSGGRGARKGKAKKRWQHFFPGRENRNDGTGHEYRADSQMLFEGVFIDPFGE